MHPFASEILQIKAQIPILTLIVKVKFILRVDIVLYPP